MLDANVLNQIDKAIHNCRASKIMNEECQMMANKYGWDAVYTFLAGKLAEKIDRLTDLEENTDGDVSHLHIAVLKAFTKGDCTDAVPKEYSDTLDTVQGLIEQAYIAGYLQAYIDE